jgi:8-oxo-dGTP pyrophosphatase MutT (NUDIX family)
MAHIHEKIDFTAEVFIVYRNTVLLRMHDKYKIWLGVGGHVELDEDPNEAAVREVKEEVGLDVVLWNGNQTFFETADGNKQLIPPIAMNRHVTKGIHEHVSLIYFATSQSDVVVPEAGADRSDQWRWCTKEDLQTIDLRADVRFFAAMALDTLIK